MATVDKNFKVKHGLVVEGTTATVNGDDIITATQSQTLSNKEFNGETKFHAANGAGIFKINLNSTTGTTTLTGNNGDLNIVTNSGDIILNADGTTYLGGATPGNAVATQAYVDSQVLANTDALSEGSINKYFTAQRAKDAAAALLTGATLTNIQITGNGNGLTITAENGVADSTTSDLAEGTNLYFTNERAQDAVGLNVGTGLSYDDPSGAISVNTSVIATKTYVDGLASNYDAAGAASTAETNAKSYTDNLIGDPTVNGTSGNTVKARIDTAVANLVDSAPELLNTLNELAAAIADNPNYATDMATSLSGKQNTLTAGTAVDITSDTLSVKVDDYTIQANGGAGNDSLIVNTSVIASKNYVDTNFVNVADLPGQLGDYVPLTQKAAANGVATLDGTGNVPSNQLGNVPTAFVTSLDVAESNLSVTSGALSLSTTPIFQSVRLGWYATEVQGYASGNTGATLTPLTLGNGASAKLIVRCMSNVTGHSQMSEILVTKDSSNNVAITEYAIVGTNGSLGDVSATWDNVTGINITFVPTENSTEVMVSGTSYIWND